MRILPLLVLATACSRPTFDKLDDAFFGAAPGAGGSFPAAMAKPGIEISGHADTGVSLAFTPDGAHLVSAGYGDYALIVWSAADGTEVSRAKMEHRPSAVAKADGKIAILR